MGLIMLTTATIMIGCGIYLGRTDDLLTGAILVAGGSNLMIVSYAAEWLEKISGQLGGIGSTIDKQ